MFSAFFIFSKFTFSDNETYLCLPCKQLEILAKLHHTIFVFIFICNYADSKNRKKIN